MPGPIRRPGDGHTKYVQPATSTTGDGVAPGSVKSPVPSLTLPGSKNVKVGGMHIGTIHVAALRSFLIHKGYHLPEEGGFGPRLKAALADFVNPKQVGGPLAAALGKTRITGNRDPEAWNKLYGSSPGDRAKVLRPVTGPGGLLDGNGNDPPDTSGNGSVDVSGLNGLSSSNLFTTLPTTLASKLADLKYGASIKEAQTAVDRQPGQADQDLHDIEHWYGQVLGAQKTATGRDSDMTKAGVSSVRDAVSRIVSSLGGSANEGSGDVGAAGENQVGTLQALGTTQDQYNSDIAPLLKDEAAGAKTRQVNLNTTNAQDLARQLAELQQERGGEEASQRMNIVGFNNDVSQKQFGDDLAVQQAKEAAALTGAKIIGALNNPKLPKGAFDNTSGTQKIGIANQITSALTDGNGQLKSGWDAPRAINFINSQIQSAGWHLNDPHVVQFRQSILGTLGLMPGKP
jgi:hypothetical protein